MLLLAAALLLPAQLTLLADPPCGTIVETDDTEVTYTADLDCTGQPFALRVTAVGVDVDGAGHVITTDGTAIEADGASALSLRALSLVGGTVGVDVSGGIAAVVDGVTVSGASDTGMRFTSADNVVLVNVSVAGGDTCVAFVGGAGDDEIVDSALVNCASAGVDWAGDGTLFAEGNAVTSILGTGTGLLVDGAQIGSELSNNFVLGYATAAQLSATADVELVLGDVCAASSTASGIVLADAVRTIVTGSLSGFDTAIALLGASADTQLEVGFSGNAVDVDDQSDGPTTRVAVPLVDSDADGLADVCDPQSLTDIDGDGIQNAIDNCAFIVNVAQDDLDGDGFGDACDGRNDLDADGDGVINSGDNCAFVGNTNQDDNDGDGLGDACDPRLDDDDIPVGPGGPASLVSVQPLPEGDAFCAGGGARVETGVDDDGDGLLNLSEVDSSVLVCNGAPGAQGDAGAPGAAGADGFLDKNGDGVDDRAGVGGGQNCAESGAPGPLFALLLAFAFVVFASRRRA